MSTRCGIQESAGESWEDDIFSSEADTDNMPNLVSVNSSLTSFDDLSSKSDISELTLEVDVIAERYWANARHVSESLDNEIPDLMSVSDSSEGSEMPDLVSASDSSEGSSDVKMTTVQMKSVIHLTYRLRWWMKP
jgi:hypothetical protein